MKTILQLLGAILLGLYASFVIKYGYNNLITELFPLTKLTYFQVYSAVSLIGVIMYTTKVIRREDADDIGAQLFVKFFVYTVSLISFFILTLFL